MNTFKKGIISWLDSMFGNNPSEYRELVKDLKEEGLANDPANKISQTDG